MKDKGNAEVRPPTDFGHDSKSRVVEVNLHCSALFLPIVVNGL